MSKPQVRTFPVFGMEGILMVEDANLLDEGLRQVLRICSDVDEGCSRFRSDSDLSRVNGAHGARVHVSATFGAVLELSLRAARVTGGAVDPTVGTALEAVGYDRDIHDLRNGVHSSGTVPVRIPGWQVVEWDPAALTVRVPDGVKLDFGSLAKAYAVDLGAVTVAGRCGTAACVAIGGDVAAAGEPREPWRIGIAEDHRTVLAKADDVIGITGGGVATSSTTVRTWMQDGVRRHHIIDPGTGLSTCETYRTVTVVAGTCVEANTASTAAIVWGSGARKRLEGWGVHGRLVTTEGDVEYAGQWPRKAAA